MKLAISITKLETLWIWNSRLISKYFLEVTVKTSITFEEIYVYEDYDYLTSSVTLQPN